MENSMESSMLSTKEFIRRKCVKDHFKGSSSQIFKHSSMYSSDYKQQLINKLKNVDWSVEKAKQMNHETNKSKNFVSPFLSVYRKSFQKNQISPLEKYHEKPSFFIKNQSYGPIESTYKLKNDMMQRSMVNKENIDAYHLQKGRPRLDNLAVAKYNKMNAKSLYMDSYEDYTKLPSLYKNKHTMTARNG